MRAHCLIFPRMIDANSSSNSNIENAGCGAVTVNGICYLVALDYSLWDYGKVRSNSFLLPMK